MLITVLKIVFAILICCPLIYVLVFLFGKIVDEAAGSRDASPEKRKGAKTRSGR